MEACIVLCNVTIADTEHRASVLQEDVRPHPAGGEPGAVGGAAGDLRGAAEDGNPLPQGGPHLAARRPLLSRLRHALRVPE